VGQVLRGYPCGEARWGPNGSRQDFIGGAL
jgi:hypothetical protein